MNMQFVLALALTLGSTCVAFAQSHSQEEQAACMDDAFKFCGNAIPDRERVFYCLAENRHAISPRCHTMMLPYLPAEAAGLKVVMNRCPKIEYGRLSSEIAWMGVNTRTLSSQKAKLFGRGIQRMSLNRTTTAGGTTEAAMRAQKDEASR